MRLIPKETQELLDAIFESKYEPKGKEKGMIRSAEEAIEKDWRLTPGQSKYLQDIYKKAAGGGQTQRREYVG